MADGTYMHTTEAALMSVVVEAMGKRLLFATLRQHVAVVGKQYGVFVYGTDRVEGAIVVTYEGGSVTVPETDEYRRSVPLSTW